MMNMENYYMNKPYVNKPVSGPKETRMKLCGLSIY